MRRLTSLLASLTIPASAALAVGLLCAVPGVAAAAGGPLGIDHELPYANNGIWKRSVQNAVVYGLISGEVIGAVWEGGETRFGRTLWQSIDASVAGGIASGLLKKTFSRVRPNDGNNPDLWFKGHGNASFPSGEVTTTSAIVTPLVLEYAADHPAVYALELLPIYDAIARMKVQAHWQTDVIAGFAIGTTVGWLVRRNRDTPYVLRIMPHAIYVGIRTH
jgi:membrane-associated phospholipid phosphatase